MGPPTAADLGDRTGAALPDWFADTAEEAFAANIPGDESGGGGMCAGIAAAARRDAAERAGALAAGIATADAVRSETVFSESGFDVGEIACAPDAILPRTLTPGVARSRALEEWVDAAAPGDREGRCPGPGARALPAPDPCAVLAAAVSASASA